MDGDRSQISNKKPDLIANIHKNKLIPLGRSRQAFHSSIITSTIHENNHMPLAHEVSEYCKKIPQVSESFPASIYSFANQSPNIDNRPNANKNSISLLKNQKKKMLPDYEHSEEIDTEKNEIAGNDSYNSE